MYLITPKSNILISQAVYYLISKFYFILFLWYCKKIGPKLILQNNFALVFNKSKPSMHGTIISVPIKSLVLLKIDTGVMKKIIILLMVLAIGVALYEQSSSDKNIYVMVIAIVVFMMGMMKLSSKTPSKNQDKKEDDV